MRKLISMILLLMMLFINNVWAEEIEKIEVTLVKCVDGDTAVFNLNGEETKFRFLAIDTPESVHPTKDVQAYGKEASTYTCELLENANTIYVEYDEKGSKTDKYGRNLAWIWVDDNLLQSVLVRNGYATVAYVYYKYSYVPDLCATQQLAIDEKINIWSDDREVGYCSTIDYDDASISDVKTYNVIFEDGDTKTSKTVVEGQKIESIDATTKDGYIFSGWYLNDELFDFDTIINSDITLVAKYDLNYSYFIYAFIIIISSFILKKSKKRKRKNK